MCKALMLRCAVAAAVVVGGVLSCAKKSGQEAVPETTDTLSITYDIFDEAYKTTDTLKEDDKPKIDMVFVKGGTFKMGCTDERTKCDDDEKPARNVTVGDFYIGKYEVTQKQWSQVMKRNRSAIDEKNDDLPLVDIGWDDIGKFIERLNSMTGKEYRLPTEAEWEFAARGGSKSKGYLFAGSNNPDIVAWYSDNSNYEIHTVGAKKPNELGIYDMSGNVPEWVNDSLGDGSYGVEDPSYQALGTMRIFRGGGNSDDATSCRVFSRDYDTHDPDLGRVGLGFRLASSVARPSGKQGTLTDKRDGKTYRTVKIGNQTWMAENLNFKTDSSSYCYADSNHYCDKYGRLYIWEAAKKACPAGYHLPNNKEWENLVDYVGGWNVAVKKLRAKNGWNGNYIVTDDYGFSALPGGMGHPDYRFFSIGDDGFWWAPEKDGSFNTIGIIEGDYMSEYDYGNTKSGYSVRCVQNANPSLKHQSPKDR